MSESKGAASAKSRRRRLRLEGLRPAKHRSYCFVCKNLTKRGVGGGKYICLDCGR